MNTVTVSQSARPLRIAFLANKNSYKDAMQINTALWGGEANPIIPVKVTASKKEQTQILNVLADFDPDVIVNMTKYSYPYIESVYKNGVLRKVHFQKSELFGKSHRTNKPMLNIGTSVRPVLVDLWKEAKLSKEASNFHLLKNKSFPSWEPMLIAVFGKYPSSTPLNFQKDFEAIVFPKEIELTETAIDDENLYERGSRLSLTLYQLEHLGGGYSSMSSHIIYLGKLDGWKDLVEFWNIRAAGKEIAYIPFEYYKSFKKTARRIVRAGDYPINPNVQNSSDLMSGPSVSEAELNEYADWLRDEGVGNLSRRHFGVHWHRRMTMITPDIEIARLETAEKEEILPFDEDHSLQFYLSPPKFLASSKGMREKAWANVIQIGSYFGKDYTFSFPINPKVEELVQRSMLELDNSRLSHEGIVVLSGYPKNRMFFMPLHVLRVIEALFESAGIKVKLSHPGRITQNLIDFLGGIEGCRLLKVDGIRHSLKEVNKKSVDAHNIINTIRSNWHSEDDDDMILIANQPRPLTPQIAFEALVSSKLIRPGIDFRCSQCGEKAWYSVKDFGEQFECIYCFLKQDVPRLDKENWTYTGNGLVRIQDEGYGSLPVILSLWRLNHLGSLRSAQGHTSIELTSPKIKCEIDYVYLVTTSSGDYEWVIGEAKGFEEITPKVIKKMKAIADYFENKPYIALTTLRDELSDAEKKRIQTLINRGYKVIIFTRKELEPYDLFDRFEGLRNKYVSQLSDLAENTQQLNL